MIFYSFADIDYAILYYKNIRVFEKDDKIETKSFLGFVSIVSYQKCHIIYLIILLAQTEIYYLLYE